MHHLNLSDHTHISIELPGRTLMAQVSVKEEIPQSTKQRIDWSKCDRQEYRKVQVGKDQEKAQSEKDSHSKNRGGKKPN